MQIPNATGVLIGHSTDIVGVTGCTVVLCPTGATGAVEVRGGAPCTRETDIFRLMAGVDPRRVHGVVISGGSVFGLAAVDGVVRYLNEHGIGFQSAHACIPIIGAAGLYDLGVGSATIRPDAASGYAACAAASGGTVAEGSVGAGTGATVGKAAGMDRCSKGGVGVAHGATAAGAQVQAIVVVNAFGEVVDPGSGQIVAGIRRTDGPGFEPTRDVIGSGHNVNPLTNTTIGVVVTNLSLTREEATELARAGHDGLARTIRPVHTRVDGDTIFVLATGAEPAPGLSMGEMIGLSDLTTTVVAEAVLRGARQATSLGGVPAVAAL